MKKSNRILVVTMGDPLSVNCEVIATLIEKPVDHPLLIVGCWSQWCQQTPAQQSLRDFEPLNWPSLGKLTIDLSLAGRRYFLNVESAPSMGPNLFDFSQDIRRWSELQRGLVARISLEALALLPDDAEIAVLTSPIDKKAVRKAGFGFPGQTEFFADLWSGKSIMVLAGPRLRVGLVTNHIAIQLVPSSLTVELICSKIQLFCCVIDRLMGSSGGRLAVCGLNPHASDGGLFGEEEQKVIAPAIEQARNLVSEGWGIEGPISADTAFHFAATGRFDGVLAMYHDQGLAPVKTLNFYDAVNITGGLRHFRVSPDHGPAQDLFGKNLARSDSFTQAWQCCLDYLRFI